MALYEREFVTESGKRLKKRPSRLRPLNPACPLYLRRICGTCAAFPKGAAITAEGMTCARRKIITNGKRCAASCTQWERKNAPAPTSQKGK